jgi:uncharacterized RDD family membrane protein YckC
MTMQDIQIQYAGFWRRFAALMIDQILLAICAFVLIFTLRSAWFYITLFITVVYDIGSHCRFGATIGQRILRIRVIDKTGHHPSLGRNIGRFFARMLSGMPFYYGYIRSLWDDHRQTWHDEWTETYVVHSNSPGLEILSQQNKLLPAQRLKLPRPITILYVAAGVSLIALLSQILLKFSESTAFAQKDILADPVIKEMCGPNTNASFRFGNPFYIFGALAIGNIYFNVEGDSGKVLARSHVYDYYGILDGWVDVDYQEWGYEMTSTIGRRLCMKFARRGLAFLNEKDSVNAYQLFRRAMSINYDYANTIESREHIEADTAEILEDIEWYTSQLKSGGIYLYPEGYERTDIDAEVDRSYLIRVLLSRGFCYNVIGEPFKAIADYDSLLVLYPWLFPVYLEKSNTFLQMNQFDSAAYYLSSYFAVEPDTNSIEFQNARSIQNRLSRSQ